MRPPTNFIGWMSNWNYARNTPTKIEKCHDPTKICLKKLITIILKSNNQLRIRKPIKVRFSI
jgi:sucrose-6-phosphate hydrolase SacC (GH32 family)